MKAIFFEQHGGPEVLRYGELPDPVPQPGEALIKVRAVGLNRLDIWVRQGWPGLSLKLPHVTGSDVVGDIISVNAHSVWQPGTRVMINPGIVTGEDEWTRRGEDSISPHYKILGEQVSGGLAEYVTVPLANLYKIPDSVTDEEAASSLLVGTTCWRMLFKRARLQAGQSVLVVGSGGGVNSLSILLAKSAGASVIALASNPDKARRARELGADETIDYKATPQWAVEVMRLTKSRGVDVVVDNVGAQTITQSIRAVARGGCIVTVGNTSGHQLSIDNRLLFTKQISLMGSTMGSKQDFVDAMNYLFTRKIKVPIDSVTALKNGIAAIQKLESGVQFGKLVLKP